MFISSPRHQSVKPRHDHHAHHHADKPAERSGLDQKKPQLCFICNQPGHFARDHEPGGKVHIRAAHTEWNDDDADDEREEDNAKSSHHEPEADQAASQHDGEELVEVDVYDNDWYERASVSEQMLAIRHDDKVEDQLHSMAPPPKVEATQAQFCKVKLQAEKTARHRPIVKPEDKECLATYVKIGECEAWTLWDSGSTTTGITPSFAEVANIWVFPLADPHILQLGTIGSHATVNFGTDIKVEIPGGKDNIYVDIANFDRYDMIIGTPFMHKNKVLLDFDKNQVVVNSVATPARHVVLDKANRRLRQYRSTEKRRE